MTTVFIGGSRRITRLNDTIRYTADNIMRQRFAIVIGDANGADKAVQSYLAEKAYRDVIVYCMGDHCRNNVGSWPVEQIYADNQLKDFAYYTTKDAKMAQVASYGFMVWDGKSKGTLNNILNLLDLQKNILVYFSPDRSCDKLKSHDDLTALLKKCSSEIKEQFEKEFSLLTPIPFPER
ncbi:MAG: hypothetical protein J4F29_10015 [Candidatus Latescibacteria bacterium]|nr:hypothetical protein [Candidatus Latescibacterota bacterium]